MLTTQSQHIHQSEFTTKGRCVALFPGAFRPPHTAHLTAVLDLAARPNVDQVVVIVSNRCRCIPGTSKALDANVALRVWAVYLQTVAHKPGIDKVRVERAPHTAVRYALGYFDRAKLGDSLLFCIGENDLEQGDGRFAKLTDLSQRSGVAAKLVAAPTGSIAVRSTILRKTLARGAAGRVAFIAALPSHLNTKQRAQVWLVCHQGLQEWHDIIKNKVGAIMERQGVGAIAELNTLSSNAAKLDPVFRARCKDGGVFIVKYAGDTVESATPGENSDAKPRQRLATERRTLKRLDRNAEIQNEVELPEIVLYDKVTRTLVLTEVCPNGRSLEDDLKKGVFDPAVAGVASRFLARCHTIAGPVGPLWGDRETDLRHWRKLLALRTTVIDSDSVSMQVRGNLTSLALASEKARLETGNGRVKLILGYGPRNILLSEGKIGIVDLELSSSVGDPALDVGFFLGHYVLWGLRTNAGRNCQKALRQALKAYQQGTGDLWLSIHSRVVAFAGATILHQVLGAGRIGAQQCESQLVRTAAALLASGSDQLVDTDTALTDAVVNRLF